MSEIVLGINLKVTCADQQVYENVTMKTTASEVVFLNAEGEELKDKRFVQNISEGTFLKPPEIIDMAIYSYRRQKQ